MVKMLFMQIKGRSVEKWK